MKAIRNMAFPSQRGRTPMVEDLLRNGWRVFDLKTAAGLRELEQAARDPDDPVVITASDLAALVALARLHSEEPNLVEYAGFKMDTSSQQVYWQDSVLNLTHMEYSYLKVLIEARGRIVTIEEVRLLTHTRASSRSNNMAVFIRYLREKLQSTCGLTKRQAARLIQAVRGTGGYKLVPLPE